jgi:transposase
MRGVDSFKAVFIHREPVDMRRGINGLSEIVQLSMNKDVMGPHLFVFCGRRRNAIKVLYFDKSGFCLWQKRLERERFPWPRKLTEDVVQLSTEQFSWLLEGFDVWNEASHVLTTHVLVNRVLSVQEVGDLKRKMKQSIKEKFGVLDATIEIKFPGQDCSDPEHPS